MIRAHVFLWTVAITFASALFNVWMGWDLAIERAERDVPFICGAAFALLTHWAFGCRGKRL